MSDGLAILVGLVTLLVGAELLVRGSVWIALTLGVRPMVVGVTIVAFGTSTPELVVGLVDIVRGSQGLAAGTVFGSNIANIALIVGLSAAVRPMFQSWGESMFESAVLLGVTLLTPLPLLLGIDVTRSQGLVLTAILVAFVFRLAQRARGARRNQLDAAGTPAPRPRADALAGRIAMIIGGIVGLVFGAEWLVDGSRGLAESVGVSDSVIGQTVVAVGTSLPELATSVVAAARGHAAIALGNVIGSNIFNICMVLGTTAIVRPIPMTWAREGPAVAMGLALTFALVFALRAMEGVSRISAALLLAAYAGYVAYSIL